MYFYFMLYLFIYFYKLSIENNSGVELCLINSIQACPCEHVQIQYGYYFIPDGDCGYTESLL